MHEDGHMRETSTNVTHAEEINSKTKENQICECAVGTRGIGGEKQITKHQIPNTKYETRYTIRTVFSFIAMPHETKPRYTSEIAKVENGLLENIWEWGNS